MLGIGSIKTLVIDSVFFNRISAPLLKSFFGRNGATVFIYHLVCDEDYQEFLKSKNLSQLKTDLFKDHLAWLLDNGFSFVTVDELAHKLRNKEEISSKLIAITFDDGFKITINNVLPILELLKIKATFFIASNWIDSKILLWQQRYFWFLEKYGLKDFFDKIRQIDKKSFSGMNLFQCHKKFMQDILPAQKEMFLKQYNRPIPREKDIATDIYPNIQDVQRLKAAGMQIGSHSCGHHFMQNFPDDLYLQEMKNSKEKLENLINEPVRSFSYPFNSYREDDEIIEKVGYQTLCTVDSRKVNKFSLLTKLPRFDAPARSILFESSLRRIIYFNK